METSARAASRRSRLGATALLLILVFVVVSCSAESGDEASEGDSAPASASKTIEVDDDPQTPDADAAVPEADGTPEEAPLGTDTPIELVDGQLFFEDFAGSGSMARFDLGLYHRDDFLIRTDQWTGDHAVTGPGDLCGPPDEQRPITRGERDDGFNFEWIYRCVPGGDLEKAHIMTSIGDTSGYSIGAFTPTETFTGVREVRWDVNITDLGFRQFTEVKIIPAENFDFQAMPCAVDLPCNTPDVDEVGGVAVSFFNHLLQIHNGKTMTKDPRGPWYRNYPDDPALSSVVIRRTQVFRDNGDGTLTFGVEREDGSFDELTVPGGFPDGPVRVIFADHNYTPEKADPSSFTWHWDDIEILGGEGGQP